MEDERGAAQEQLRQRIAEFNALIAQWSHADDADARWIVALLRDAVRRSSGLLEPPAP